MIRALLDLAAIASSLSWPDVLQPLPCRWRGKYGTTTDNNGATDMREYFTDSMTTTKAEPRHRIVFTLDAVTLQQRAADRFAVRYGKQVRADLTYNAACTELGAAIVHQLACDGELDDA